MFKFFRSSHVNAAVKTIAEQSTLSGPYIVMNSLAAIIACYGLLADSPSGVIGAMIVASLISPLNGVAVSLVRGEGKLLRTSCLTLLVGAALVYVLGLTIGALHSGLPVSREMLARTQPTVLDLVIAFASGVAGTIAMISPRFNPAIVGVAVSTALVPPLCSSAMFAARGEFRHAIAAAVLAITNMLAIQLAASFVLWIGGAADRRGQEPTSHAAVMFRHLASIGGIAMLAFGLIVQLSNHLKRQDFLSNTKTSLQQSLEHVEGLRVVDVTIEDGSKGSVIFALVRSRGEISEKDVAVARSALPRLDGVSAPLVVRRVPVEVIGSLDDIEAMEETGFAAADE